MKRTAARRPSLYFLFIVLMFRWQAVAQTDTLSLQQALELAQRQNESIKAAEIGVQQSASQVRELKALRLPSIFLRSHYLHLPGVGYNEIVTNGGDYGVQLSTSYPLFDGGTRNALIGQSMDNMERSTIALTRSKTEIAFVVRTLYYEILRASEELRIRQEAVERLEDYVSLLNQLRLGGYSTQSDLLKAQVDLDNAKINVETARQESQRAKLQLSNTVGLSLERNIDLVDIGTPDSTAVGSQSIESNPEYQLLQRDKSIAAYDVAIAKAERLPVFSITGDAGVLGVNPDEFRHDAGYSIVLSLDVPLLSWGAVSNRIQQRELALEQFDAQIRLQRRELETQWRVTAGDFEVARKNLAGYTRSIQEAGDNYLVAKSRFAGGSGSNLEVLDAQRLLVEAKINYNATIFHLRIDLAIALKLTGHF